MRFLVLVLVFTASVGKTEGWIRTERDLNSSMGRDGIILACIDTLTGCSSAFAHLFRLAAHALHEEYRIVSFYIYFHSLYS